MNFITEEKNYITSQKKSMVEEDIIFADIDGISDEMKFLRETKDKIVSEFVNFHFISSEKFRWYVKYNSDDYFIVVLDGLEDKDKQISILFSKCGLSDIWVKMSNDSNFMIDSQYHSFYLQSIGQLYSNEFAINELKNKLIDIWNRIEDNKKKYREEIKKIYGRKL